MKYSKLDGLDKPVARLLQGGIMLTPSRRDENRRLLDAVFEAGFNAFDTAHSYGHGDSERELGSWINDRGIRDEVVILTKCSHPEDGIPDRVRPEFIKQDLEESLERLGTDHIELYLLHRDSPDFPVGEIVDTLHEAKEAGSVGLVGGSNWLAPRVEAANAYAAKHGKTPFTISSPQFSVAEMIKPPWEGCISVSGGQGESDRAYYDAAGISLFTWSSLAGGFMTGKFRRDNLDSFTAYMDTNPIGAYAYESNFQRLDRVLELAADKGASPAQISAAYVVNSNQRYHAIVASYQPDEVSSNAAAADMELSADEIAWLEMKNRGEAAMSEVIRWGLMGLGAISRKFATGTGLRG